MTEGETTVVKFGAVDDKAAAKIERMVRQTLMMGKIAALGYFGNEVAKMAEQSGRPLEGVQQAVQVYGNRLAEYLESHMRPQRDGKQLVFRAETGAGSASSVATTGILVGMLLPAIQQAREAARRAQSMNNLRQIALACLNYESSRGEFPRNILDEEGRPLLSWRVRILPFLEQQALYDQFHLDEPWDSPHNSRLLSQVPEPFKNPNSPDPTRTVYQGFAGEGAMFSGKRVTIGSIVDGTSNTILCVESDPVEAVDWTRPTDLFFDPYGRTTRYVYDDRNLKTQTVHPDHVDGSSPGDADYGIEAYDCDALSRTIVLTEITTMMLPRSTDMSQTRIIRILDSSNPFEASFETKNRQTKDTTWEFAKGKTFFLFVVFA